MITNIIVVASIVLVAIFVVAYKSKRQQISVKCGCGKKLDYVIIGVHASPDIIVSENAAAAPVTGSFENIKETVTNDTGGYSPPTS
jgi:hypothetical protein